MADDNKLPSFLNALHDAAHNAKKLLKIEAAQPELLEDPSGELDYSLAALSSIMREFCAGTRLDIELDLESSVTGYDPKQPQQLVLMVRVPLPKRKSLLAKKDPLQHMTLYRVTVTPIFGGEITEVNYCYGNTRGFIDGNLRTQLADTIGEYLTRPYALPTEFWARLTYKAQKRKKAAAAQN